MKLQNYMHHLLETQPPEVYPTKTTERNGDM
jgi:hypothetical protein